MSPRILRSALLLSLLLCSTAAFASVSVQDRFGQKISLPQKAHRIITLAPNLTEIMFEIGAGNDVVAVSAHSDYPPAALKLPTVGGYLTVNTEQIMALHPDLVLVWPEGNSPLLIAQLQQLGLAIWAVNIQKLEDIPAQMELLGTLTGHEREAALKAKAFSNALSKLHPTHCSFDPKTGPCLKRESPKVLLIFSQNPLYAAGNLGLPAELLKRCGGENIFKDVPKPSVLTNIETVWSKNPDVIFQVSPLGTHYFENWPISATRDHHLYSINASVISRDGPRLLEAGETICHLLNPST